MIFKPPYDFREYLSANGAHSVFLAGSIEMGKAYEWQSVAGHALANRGWTVLNPRRDDWDPTWTQSIETPEFVEQVNWELDGLEAATTALFYFQPGTMSPISLMEFGLHAPRFKRTALVCPKGFWRKGNVDILADRYGIEQQGTLNEAIDYLGAAD